MMPASHDLKRRTAKRCDIDRRATLGQVMELACTYKDVPKSVLAKLLDRDPSKLIATSGSPKLDLVVGLARALDWPVSDLVDTLWDGPPQPAEPPKDRTFAELDAEALAAYYKGDYKSMLDLALLAESIAQTPDERARACRRAHGALDGQGRYREALTVCQRGLSESEASRYIRGSLSANLAHSHYFLGNLVEARGVANAVIEEWADADLTQYGEKTLVAFAYFVRAQAARAMSTGPSVNTRLAELALKDLDVARRLYGEAAAEHKQAFYEGILVAADSARLELEVALGRRELRDALESLSQTLNRVVDLASPDATNAEAIEGYGWSCIHGCNLALKLEDDALSHRYLAMFTLKATEVAERLGHWALWERVLSMDFTRRVQLAEKSNTTVPWALDAEDIRRIIGAMGRFPLFWQTGWSILRMAGVVI